ncbi:hypothetical protein BD414DRAFT_60158 [Trametes punicea]|nr:hypothetical protein BD414DRAFT_60158 [Trametes punicea]
MDAPVKDSTIPFSFFVELVQAIAAIQPHRSTQTQPRTARYLETRVYKTFKRWVTALHERYSPLPAGTVAVVLRSLFPEEDVDRKFGMQETRLAQYIAKILGVSSISHGRGERLRYWNGEHAFGCLGSEVETVMSNNSSARVSKLSLIRVDALLAELAAKCPFSAAQADETAITLRRSREAILTELYTSLSPSECSVATQIILKDLRPLLYPIPQDASHYTSALLGYKSNAIAMLTKEAAMHAWDPSGRLSLIFKTRANLAEAACAFEGFANGEGLPQPTVGLPIQIPKCVKGQGPAQSLRVLSGADKVWVETKYDGERAQIHVWFDENSAPHIRIFSKSGRDSTLDRAGIHAVILDSLSISIRGFPVSEDIEPASREPSFKQSVIIEAELVAYSDMLHRIDEFWRIRSLIASTAVGARHKSPPPAPSSTQQEAMGTQCSLVSNASDEGTRHLALVFFDILILDNVSLLSFPYSERRSILERIVRVRPGYSMLAERTCITMGMADTEEKFRELFARVIADHQEGVVIKADGAKYAEKRWPWVKLKRDYIPGHGDTVDLVLLAASWEKDRARELRVPPAAYTTFYFGAVTNTEDLKVDPTRQPHFEIIFTSSYGLAREQLEELNFMIKSSDVVPCRQRTAVGLSYTFKLCPSLAPPAVFLRRPLLAELFGAGFTKAQGSLLYALRFPRIVKVFRPSDRPWIDGMCLVELQRIARAAVGRDRSGKAEDDWAKAMFRPDEPPSPGVRCPIKRKQTEETWVEKLTEFDKKRSPQSLRKRARVDAAAAKKAANINEENADASMSGSPRARAGVARLHSISNLVSPLPRRENQNDCPPGPSKRPFTPTSSYSDQSTQHIALHPMSPISPARAESLQPLQAEQTTPAIHGSSGRHQFADAPISQSSPVASGLGTPPSPSTSKVFTIHQFLQDSAVWLARPHGTPRPVWRAPSHAVIAAGCQLQSLPALLVACGWEPAPSCSWARRGVVFVDESEDDGAWFSSTLEALARKRAALLGQGASGTCKPIFVMSMKQLAHNALADKATAEEFEGRAICLLG